MIVWLASFPRSGNTFLRIVLHRHFGVRASVAYDFDGVAERVGMPRLAELVNNARGTDGALRTHILFAMTDEQWKARRSENLPGV